MVFVTSPDYRIEYMNEPARRKIGRDMTGKHCFMVFHGLEERCPWCMGELVLQGQTVRQEIQGQLDKRWYSNVITPLYRKDGSVAIQALVFDITDQKQAQAALVQSEAILRSIHQAAPMGIGVVKSRVLDWTNEQISRMTGYTAEEPGGKAPGFSTLTTRSSTASAGTSTPISGARGLEASSRYGAARTGA